jgi:hypothetical protein
VLAVDADHVVPLGEARGVRLLLGDGRDAAPHETAQHHHLEPELLGGEFHLLDRLFGRVHRDDRRRNDAIAEPAELVGGEDVVSAADRAA